MIRTIYSCDLCKGQSEKKDVISSVDIKSANKQAVIDLCPACLKDLNENIDLLSTPNVEINGKPVVLDALNLLLSRYIWQGNRNLPFEL